MAWSLRRDIEYGVVGSKKRGNQTRGSGVDFCESKTLIKCS